MIRFFWHYYSQDALHATDLEITELTSEAVIKERIAVAKGDRTLAQYINITRMERV